MNNIIKKGLVVAVILLFVGLAFAPSINANVNKISVNPIPDLNCEGELTWLNLTPKVTVTGYFTVENIGEEDSELDWEIESFPEWGNWSFNPDSWNNQKPEDGPVKVEVEVVAPDEITGDLGGMIKIINKENPDDFCEISAFWRKKSINAEMIEIVPKPFDLDIDDIKELIYSSKAFTSEETPFASSESFAVLGNLPLDEEEISYYNPDTLINPIGLQGITPPHYWSSAIRLTQDELAPWAGWEIGKVLVFLSCDNWQSEVWANLTIYGEGTPTMPGEIIYQDTGLYFNKTDFYKIPLDEPIPISKHNEIWIAMTWKQTEEYAYIAIADDGPAVDGKGDWVSQDGGASWQELQNYYLDYNWGMGAIVGWNWWPPVFIIRDVKGPIGVNAVVENVGEESANNLEWSITITGGILGMVNKHTSGTKTELAPGETEPISSGLFFGFGHVYIEITADADNAEEITVSKEAFLLGPFVFGIK